MFVEQIKYEVEKIDISSQNYVTLIDAVYNMFIRVKDMFYRYISPSIIIEIDTSYRASSSDLNKFKQKLQADGTTTSGVKQIIQYIADKANDQNKYL